MITNNLFIKLKDRSEREIIKMKDYDRNSPKP